MNNALQEPTALIAAMICAGICTCIFMYRRRGSPYKLGFSLCAYALGVSTGCYSLRVMLHLALGHHVDPVSPWLLIVLAVMLAIAIRARGNVAQMLRGCDV